MERLVLNSIICGCLLWPLAATAQSPFYGIYTSNSFFYSENHPKRLQVALAITKEIALDGVPLSFNTVYAGASKGKVILKVTVLRGEEVLWGGKRRMKLKSEDIWHSFCDTYDEGLLPGDVVVFDLTFRKVPRMGEEEEGGMVMAQVGPTEIWENADTYPWTLPEFDCLE